MGLLQNKRALIVGVVNDYSIAYGIAKCMQREDAQIALTYQNEKVKGRVENIAKEIGSKIIFPCDLAYDDQIDDLFVSLQKHWDKFDILVHSVAFAPGDQLEGSYAHHVTREGSRIAHDISSYSFAALTRASIPMMSGRNGALLTISHIGAEKALMNYNIMGPAKASLEANVRYLANSLGQEGIRVNAISAGPIRTLASSAVGGIGEMIRHVEEIAPLKRTVTQLEVGNTAAFLCSDLSSGITGQVIYVDAGYEIMGM